MKFSICTAITYDVENADNLRMPRYDMFLRCANSIRAQTFRDFEWIIIDDVSNPPVTREMIPAEIENVKIIRLPEKSGRVIAYNRGWEACEGEWICMLDGDDEYSNIYLEAMNDAIRVYPDYKLFNMNHLMFGYDYKTWVRKFIDMSIQKDLPFPSGTIGTGAFVFHKDAYKEVGNLPELGLWDFANWAFEKFPEIKPFYAKNDGSGNYNSLGNPWGNDYLMFYMLTRKFPCKYLDTALYYVHSRWGHRWPDDPDYVVDPGKAPEWNANNK